MVFEQIERLKREYTDKYVVVDDTRPELRRFKGQTGTVRTVNMSGRALVEFDAHENIGWFDIGLDFLKVIDQPLPKPEKPAAKPAKGAATKPAKGAAKPAAKPAATKKPAAGLSVEEMLAAARGGKTGGAPAKTAPAKKPAAGLSVEEILAAARGGKAGGGPAKTDPAKAKTGPKTPPAAAPAKAAPRKMSVEEMLAAARAEKATPSGSPDTGATTQSPAEPPATARAPEGATTEATPRDDLPTDTDDVVEYCRHTDGNSV